MSKTIIINFSSRPKGNCAQIARFLKDEWNDSVLREFSALKIAACGNCEYECFNAREKCPVFTDDLFSLYTEIIESDLVCFILPNYAGVPCSNYFIFNERSQCVFQQHPQLYERYLHVSKRFVVVSNTDTVSFETILANQVPEKTKLDILFLSAKKFGKVSIHKDLIDPPAVKRDLRNFFHLPAKETPLPEGKPLSEWTKAELWALFPIILKEHNPEWKKWYEEVAESIRSLLDPTLILRLNHIGSTSVPHLIAKPTVDLLLELSETANADAMISLFTAAGWTYTGTPTMDSPDWMMFHKGYTPQGFAPKVFHLHVRHLGDWNELYFRDYLLAHPDVATEYGLLKTKLQKQYEHDRDSYTDAKGTFIQRYTALARNEFPGRYQPR